MRRLGAALLAVVVAGAASPAWAKKKAPADDQDSGDDGGDDGDSAPKPAKKKKSDDKKDKKADKDKADKDDADGGGGGDDEDEKPKPSQADEDFKKQDLTGHDLGTKKKTNEFEKDRFFVDKQDTDATENKTLIQGSVTSTSFYYSESGGPYTDNPNVPMGTTIGNSASNFARMFTDLRLQTDFRHIKGGDWDGRVDARVRFVDQPTDNSGTLPGTTTSTEVKVQSGLTGQNEYEIRELWLVRNGDRSDVILGRQFIPDLAGVKIDGVRIDYAQSKKFTLLGFGGLFPLRGSRSIMTDYIPDNFIDAAGNRQAVGRFTGTAGGGAAYRTVDAYGSFGGVVQAPLGGGEEPRVFATATGYYRAGTKLDFYHFAVLDLVGTQATQGGILTNVSAGLNYKPDPRLRFTASVNRVDNETLSVQAGAFLNSADQSHNLIDNEVYLQRLATNEVRGSAAASIGPLQRFEIVGALTFKYRPTVTLNLVGGDPNVTPTTPVTLQAEQGAEFYGSFTDRHSFKDARLGADVTQTFGIGSVEYMHTQLFGIRAFGAHDFKDGRGEGEVEIAYTRTSDSSIGGTCSPMALDSCFGASVVALFSVGGSAYYRFNRDWLGLASLYVTQMQLQHQTGTGTAVTDTPVLGLTGFLRASYRF